MAAALTDQQLVSQSGLEVLASFVNALGLRRVCEDRLGASSAWKLLRRRSQLALQAEPERVLDSWLASRGRRLELAARSVDEVLADHWLIASSRKPNVVLHVPPNAVPRPVPLMLVIADLVDHGSERDLRQARELMGQLL